jgi:hypothetical protein
LLSGGYFTIIREEERFVEVKSKNTGHCWMILKKTYDANKPVVLYHKHQINDEWYHEHWKIWTVESAVKSIKSHDAYVVERPNYIEMQRRANYGNI